MEVAILVFGLLVGIFHYAGSDKDSAEQDTLAAAPAEPAGYGSTTTPKTAGMRRLDEWKYDLPAPASSDGPYAVLAAAANTPELMQNVADLVADQPQRAARVVTIAMAMIYETGTLGDIATLAATATKAAPGQAPAISGAIARTLRGRSEPALAAGVASILALVPEQDREIGLVVGAIVGDDALALGMVAQTVAISSGTETFSSLSQGSGVPISAVMKESARLGVRVPFDVPSYAAQLAPTASRFADGGAYNGET